MRLSAPNVSVLVPWRGDELLLQSVCRERSQGAQFLYSVAYAKRCGCIIRCFEEIREADPAALMRALCATIARNAMQAQSRRKQRGRQSIKKHGKLSPKEKALF